MILIWMIQQTSQTLLMKIRIFFYEHELFKYTISYTAAIGAEYFPSNTEKPLKCHECTGIYCDNWD